MINKNEVRIGNWVDGGNSSKVYYQIKAIDFSIANFDFTKPIPITHKILRKCGFAKEDMHDLGIYIFMPISDEHYLSWHCGSIWLGEYDTNCKYLHQLQNLYFALTGKELDIKL